MARTAALVLAVLAAACNEAPAPVILPVTTEIPATATATATVGGATLASPGPSPAGWAGKWRRWGGRMDPARLEIRAVSAAGFAFDITASFGGHIGGAEGRAVFTPGGARFDSPESGCGLTFRLRDGGLEVEQEEGGCATYGVRVTATGRYRPQGEKRVYETSFDCRKARGPVDEAICASPVLAGADRALRLPQRDRDACRTAGSPERCLAGAYRRRLGASGSRGFDFAAFRKRTEGQPSPWADLDLRLYLIEQLPHVRYEALADAMMMEGVIHHDDAGVEIWGCVYGVCPEIAVYLRIEPPGTVWAAVYGGDVGEGGVVLSPKKATAEPGSLGRWLEEHHATAAVREKAFE